MWGEYTEYDKINDANNSQTLGLPSIYTVVGKDWTGSDR